MHTAPSSLRTWRAAAKLTAKIAAQRLGITEAYYSKLERGIRCPSSKLAKRIHSKTHVPLAVLIRAA